MPPKKTEGPTHELEYLGLILDTQNMMCRLPADKLKRMTEMVTKYLKLKFCTKREMLSLCGNLSFATRVIPAGRSFMYRLFRAAYAVRGLEEEIFISQEAKNDLAMWLKFLQNWDGVSLFLENETVTAKELHLYTDASGKIGHGGFYQGKWFYGPWPTGVMERLTHKVSIAFQELYPIVVAAILFGKSWSRKRIVFHTDNMATKFAINNGSSKSADIMRLLRRLTLVAAKYSFHYSAVHVPGVQNKIADALSRFQLKEFRRLVPDAEPLPCTVPPPEEVML